MAVFTGRRGTWIKAIFLILLALVAGAYVAPSQWNRSLARRPFAFARVPEHPFRLGLDLKGGSHLVYEADTSKIPDREQRTSMEGVRDVIERRVNALGVAEPVVQLTRVEGKWRLIVELAGVYDTQKAIDAIGATPVLEFKEQNTTTPTLSADQEKELKRLNDEAKRKAEKEILPQELWLHTGLGGKQLKRAQIQFDPTTNEPEVGLVFNAEGTKLFEEVTQRNLQKPIAIFLDGKPPIDTDGDGEVTESDPPYAPVVQAVITNGEARITGDLTIATAKQLARRLQAGALPVPITLLAQTTVGATLGEESVATSFRVAQIVFLLVALFMVAYYRLPGLVAVLALAAYVAFVLAVMKVAGATLTLAGIAGFIMSIGMAVDANVLVFERFREELRLGRSILDALQTAFQRAWLAIRDSQATTLITCLILASFSSSVVKGFAVTLAIGTIVNLFTALTFTRALLVLVGGWTQRVRWYAPLPRVRT